MAAPSSDIFFATIPEINARLKAKEFSAKELTHAFSDRLEKLGPRYNAVALSMREEAGRKARDVDSDLKRDRTRGPLQGIPCGVKDLLSIAKQPTTWGAPPYAGQVFDYDATVVKKLEAARAIVIGKLAMVELAGGPGYRFANASLTGAGLNPWDRTRWSGGSSSGSGIAVAAGLTVFALGSETSGSILTPSSFCGVTGLRPTYGLVSRHGAMALSWTLDKIGPLCRSAEDCGLVLQAIAGSDQNDPGSAGKSFYYAPQYVREFRDIVVGYSPADYSDWAEPAARADFAKAFETVKAFGVKLKEVSLPDFPYGSLVSTILAAEASSIFEPLIESGKVDELVDKFQIAGLRAGLELPAKDYLKAMRIRSLMQDGFRKLFSDVDVLLAPARYGPAPKIGQPLDQLSPNRPQAPSRGLNGLIPAGNLAGLPALSVPCGFADNLPIGISFVGNPFSENLLLRLGNEFQAHTDWHRRRPPMPGA
jgi:aspartyl-tRNA(Asn)/glutamyl-tRNA(Gln) amidotransferase subunit A